MGDTKTYQVVTERGDFHIEATDASDLDGKLTLYDDGSEVANFPPNSWFGWFIADAGDRIDYTA